MFNDIKNNEILILILTSFFYLGLAFSMVLQREVGVIALIVMGLIIFITKNKGQELLIFLTLIFSTNVLEFFNIDELPYIQMGAGLRFNGLDLVLLPISLRSLINIKSKNIHTTSEKFILLLLSLYIVYVIVGLLLTGSPKEAGFNYLRILFYIIFYFALLEYFLVEGRIKRFLIILSVIVIIATIIQVIEFYQGYRFTFPGYRVMNENYTQEGIKIITAGGERLYFWSRLPGLLYLITIISFSLFLYNINRLNLSSITFSIGTLGIFVATIRIWIATWVFTISIILFREKTKAIVKVSMLLTLTTIILLQYSELTYSSSRNVDLISSILGRGASILNPQSQYGEQNTFIVRVIVNNININKFLESPIWGHGFGKYIHDNYYNNDVGITNRLVQFGIIGSFPIIFYVLFYLIKINKVIKSQIISYEDKAFLVSIFAILIGHLPAYFWQLDFWGQQLVFVIIISLAIGDTILYRYTIK